MSALDAPDAEAYSLSLRNASRLFRIATLNDPEVESTSLARLCYRDLPAYQRMHR
jgi:hypothetical protein